MAKPNGLAADLIFGRIGAIDIGAVFERVTHYPGHRKMIGRFQSMLEDGLRDGGFQPAIAGSGEEAITLLKAFRTKYRALVTDITLLGTLDGWRVARGAREIDPSFPIIYITGGGADDWTTKGCRTASCCRSRSGRMNSSPPSTNFSARIRRRGEAKSVRRAKLAFLPSRRG